MKKLWVAVVFVFLLGLSSWAGAMEPYHSCPNAGAGKWAENCENPDSECVETYYTVTNMGDYHLLRCPECGYTREEEHGGYTGLTHIDDLGDTTYHYEMCDMCDGVIERWEHWGVSCAEPGVCGGCDSTNAFGVEPYHVSVDVDAVDRGDGRRHMYVHLCCGAELSKAELEEGGFPEEEHFLLCYENGGTECIYCGSTNVGGVTVTHDIKYVDLNDAKRHQYKCTDCGYAASEPEEHTVLCTDPDEACTVCGTTYTYYATVQHTDVVYDISEYSHSQNCNACGEHLDWGAHTVKCTQPGVCTVCGGTDVLTSPDHSWQYVDQGNGTHLRKCADCGAKDGTSKHYRDCTDTGSGCSLCGAANVEIVVHDYSYVDQGNGETHKEICLVCGKTFDESQHTRYCTDEGSGCSWCGSDDVVYVYHWETYVDKGDGKHHTEICEECGETLNEDEHWVNCTEPGVCEFCGSTNVGGVGVLHPTASIKYVDLGKKHQQQCTDCGQKWAADWHWAYCNDTTTCRICKLTGLTLPSDQYTHRGTFTDLGASHRFTCNYCDHTMTESHWVYCTDQSKCYQCGATGFEITWENRYCTGTTEVLSYDANGHTFTCSDCKQTYTEPHSLDDDGSCSCGYVKAAAGLPGDADNNSRVTLNDAIAILEGTVSNNANADVNGDGKTDLHDALRILQYLAGWNVSLQ